MIDSEDMTLSLPEGKTQSLTKLCQQTLTSQQITLRELSSLIGKLRATSPAIVPAPLQLRYLQHLLIQKQHLYQCYESSISLDKSCKMELKWWVTNLTLLKGKAIHLEPPEMTIQSDAAKTGSWGATTQTQSTGAVEQGGKPTPHQFPETHSSRTSDKNIHEGIKRKINPYSDRQHNSPLIPGKNGGDKEYGNDNNIQTYLDLLVVKRDHPYSRMDSEFRELHSRLGIQEHNRLQRMEAMF